jgi:3-isopropylmalate dehydratase small subunit
MNEITGKEWIFGDNIDTDAIVPGQYLEAPIEEIIKHVFESINKDFVNEVKRGDIIVAGKNFGCGSSRESAAAALKELV